MKMINVFVKTDKTYCLLVNNNSQVFELKNAINEKLKISNHNYYLQFAGKILNDEDTLDTLKIVDCSTIYLNFRSFYKPNPKEQYQIFVKLDKTYTLMIDDKINIEILKSLINHKIGLINNNYYLIFAGKILDDKKLIKDYKIEKECTVHLRFRASPNPIHNLKKN